MNARLINVSVALAVAVTGCSSRTVVRAGSEKSTEPVVVAGDSRKPAPPAHAPAHGHRHNHPEDGVELVYDSKLAVYVAKGYSHCYFTNGVYFRYMDETWKLSKRVAGPWKIVVERDVPSTLKARYSDYAHKTSKLKSKQAK